MGYIRHQRRGICWPKGTSSVPLLPTFLCYKVLGSEWLKIVVELWVIETRKVWPMIWLLGKGTKLLLLLRILDLLSPST